jgi:hypothetical protein
MPRGMQKSKKLTEVEIKQLKSILSEPGNIYNYSNLAKKYGISRQAIWLIRRGKLYRKY